MPAPKTKTITCFELIEVLRTAPGFTSSRRSELLSAVRRFCEIARKHPSEVIVDPQVIRVLADRASWQLAGITERSWANILSRLTAAMTIAGVKVHRRRKNRKLDEQWEAFLASVTRRDRDELHPFAGWCSPYQIAPLQVDQEIFERYLDELMTLTIHRNPRERWHVARRAWNRIVSTISDTTLPTILNVEPDGWRGLPWDTFPSSLLAEVESFKAAALETDPFAEEDAPRAIKEVTLKNYANNLRWFLSVLVQDGAPIDQFTSLRGCLDPDLLKRALKLRLAGRPIDDKSTPGLSAMATAIVSIARRVGVPDGDLKELRRLAKKVKHRPDGMCEKNNERLAQIKDVATRRALINLPFRMARRLAKVTKPTIREAQEMQNAVLLGLLLFLPIRIKNVAALDLDRHLRRPAGACGRWLVHFNSNEVKNETAIDGTLNELLSTMIERYIAVFRPVLLKTQTSKLFVGQAGTDKDPHSLGKQFFTLIKRELGLRVNAHLMRHFAGFVYLEANPGHYEFVRQMLGHKDVKTTIAFYTGASHDASHRRYDEIILAQVDPSLLEGMKVRAALGFKPAEAL